MTSLKSFSKTAILFLFLVMISGMNPAGAQVPDRLPNENRVYGKKIKTVLLFKEGFEMSAPVINLSAGEQLKLSFDELDPDLKHYRYTIRHCEADWSTSAELMLTDYIDGFQDDAINDFAYSFNTTTNYIHYSLVFPTIHLRPRISGNYILIVYLDDPANVVLTWRFMVLENSALSIVGGNARQANNVNDHFTRQQVDFTLEFGGMTVNDPAREIKVVITQNDRWDNAIRGIVPRFARGTSFDYTDSPQTLFNGGNEFRSFDTKSLLYQTERIRRIEYGNSGYNVWLLDDPKRTFKNYVTDKEINGRKLIKNEDHAENSDVEADYAWIHFFLPFEAPVANGQIHILGALTDWQLNDSSRMNYDYQRRGYEKTLFLKQGYYNYIYVIKDNRTGRADESLIEGNHWETENEYTIWVYYHPTGALFDHLIATQDLNTYK
ncbi:MAG: DUF5103 domain-containing protein [Bacteroidetes bacterium]|nr:DUF5103 domain-containing protein [Bacteroidota bacterium]